MTRHLKIFFLSMAIIGLMAGTALAGRTTVNIGAANTAFTAALEAMGAARNVVTVGAANGPINYAVTQAITGGSVLTVTFSGAAFAGNQVRICKVDAAAAGNQVGIATPASGTTTFNFNVASSNATAAIPAGEQIYLTTEAACNATGAGSNFIVQLAASTSTTQPSVTIGASTSGGISLDTTSTKQIANIQQEFTVSVAANNNTSDYLGTPGNGTRFATNANKLYINSGAAKGAANIFHFTALNFGAANAVAAGGAGLTAAAVVSLADTANWQGLSKVFLTNTGAAANCATDDAGGNLVGFGALNGTLAFTIPAAAFNGDGAAAGANLTACILANGTSALTTPRTISSSTAVNITGTGGQSDAATAFATIDVWDTNAYQGVLGWAVNSTIVPTFCLINNYSTTRTATILMDILSSEGAVLVSGSLGTLAPSAAVLATFTGGSVTLASGTPVSISTLSANARYTAKITVTVNPNAASVTCIQTDPATGVKRAVPVFANSNAVY